MDAGAKNLILLFIPNIIKICEPGNQQKIRYWL
jgi:hypothetical protein